jgi:hypothetical protein
MKESVPCIMFLARGGGWEPTGGSRSYFFSYDSEISLITNMVQIREITPIAACRGAGSRGTRRPVPTFPRREEGVGRRRTP